jgi:hypothetical protein
MKLSALSLTAVLLQLCSAQTPKGFTPVVSQTLNIVFGNDTISPPGELVPRQGKQTPSSNNVQDLFL